MAKSKIKVPKHVVGVKIPKSVRKGPIMDFVNSTTGRILIAQALTAAIGVFAYKHVNPETRERVRGKARKGADGAREIMARNTARLSFAFGEAVTAFRTALDQPTDGNEESAPEADLEHGKKKETGLVVVGTREPSLKPGARQRMAHGLGNWAARRLEKRIRHELESYKHSPEVKWKWFRRADSPARTQNFRSLVQVNLYRYPRR